MGKTRLEHFFWYMKVDYMQLIVLNFIAVIAVSVTHKYHTPISDPATLAVMGVVSFFFFYSKWLAARKDALSI